MKAIRAGLLALFVAFAAPASAEPVAIGEFAFNLDELFPDFFQFFSIASNLAPDDPLAGLAWSALVVPIDADLNDLTPLDLFDSSGNGLIEPGESAITSSDSYLDFVQFARLDFGALSGFSAGQLTLDPGGTAPVTIFYDPEVASVPEPGTLLLVGSGLAVAAFRSRRRRT